MIDRPFAQPSVAAVFAAYPEPLRDRLLRLRDLIFEVAQDTAVIGELIETLKWGEPAYLPAKPRVGTTIRISSHKTLPGAYALYIHCQSRLADSFRSLYPGVFTFEGDRALVFSADTPLPQGPLKICIGLALTYHLKSRAQIAV